jgi:hypothetical protein
MNWDTLAGIIRSTVRGPIRLILAYIYIYIYAPARAWCFFYLFFWKRKDVTRTIVNFKFGTRQIFRRCKINGKEELGPNMSRNGNNAMLLSIFYFNYIFESLN